MKNNPLLQCGKKFEIFCIFPKNRKAKKPHIYISIYNLCHEAPNFAISLIILEKFLQLK